ncbi:hypothetical protein, partial [Legionella shakespearei]|uniref:hypothetical protein n=1 Tax=Legionella shakespearei TaxID=45075 RepID=UPI001ED992A3
NSFFDPPIRPVGHLPPERGRRSCIDLSVTQYERIIQSDSVIKVFFLHIRSKIKENLDYAIAASRLHVFKNNKITTGKMP